MTEEERAQLEDAADDHAYARTPFGGRRRGHRLATRIDFECRVFLQPLDGLRTASTIERRHDEGGGGHTPPPLHAD